MHGAKATTAIGCKSDEEILEGMLNVVPSHHFAFGRFMALANALGWVTPRASSDQLAPPITTTVDPLPPREELTPILSNLNRHLAALHTALPTRTAFVIFTGHSDPRRMSLLNAKKNAFESALKSGKTPEQVTALGLSWTMSDARDLEEATELARRGLMFLGIKQ
ncbi:hypothetical protein NLJ89_g6104 [Agrocybe chaxingu]|uniref:Uncharacterized protein n=1 Tax=Agrocybe chaxingu TaxID=84603 RepID=A0A9W8MWR0_9AGAR|nr:hypothetical protein NLJ89_g6104 [Agrocybe chaxingu]